MPHSLTSRLKKEQHSPCMESVVVIHATWEWPWLEKCSFSYGGWWLKVTRDLTRKSICTNPLQQMTKRKLTQGMPASAWSWQELFLLCSKINLLSMSTTLWMVSLRCSLSSAESDSTIWARNPMELRICSLPLESIFTLTQFCHITWQTIITFCPKSVLPSIPILQLWIKMSTSFWSWWECTQPCSHSVQSCRRTPLSPALDRKWGHTNTSGTCPTAWAICTFLRTSLRKHSSSFSLTSQWTYRKCVRWNSLNWWIEF